MPQGLADRPPGPAYRPPQVPPPQRLPTILRVLERSRAPRPRLPSRRGVQRGIAEV